MIDWDAEIAAAQARVRGATEAERGARYGRDLRAYHGSRPRTAVNACPTCEDGIRTIESPTRCRQCVIGR